MISICQLWMKCESSKTMIQFVQKNYLKKMTHQNSAVIGYSITEALTADQTDKYMNHVERFSNKSFQLSFQQNTPSSFH